MHSTTRLRTVLRRVSYIWSPRYRNTCLKCGFLAFEGRETISGARLLISAEGKTGWFTKEDPVNCYKNLWNWHDDAGINVIIFEANRPRFRCVGFRRYSPGRSPEQHLKLDDESRDFNRKIILWVLSFLGALFGAWLGVFLGLRNR